MSKKREELCDARIDTAVRSFLYDSAAQNISRYAAEGRKLQNLSEPVLKENGLPRLRFGHPLQANGHGSLMTAMPSLSCASFRLPYTLVEAEMKLIKRAAKVSAENMTDEERDSLGEKIIDHHVGERGMKN